ncbi:DUF6461 domain-containing protein [Nonomuraea sp. CA-218870]|uniref:DUF6461 domain-containing protein n=1 Tax=Nonomuraea sp. CA-218870 TaxID=3239998 RepID=UPI003D8F6415
MLKEIPRRAFLREAAMRSSSYLHDLLVSTIFTEELDDPDLWMLGFSAMWIKGADLDALAAVYGWDLDTRTACYLSDILDHNNNDGSTWVAEVNGWISMVPGHSGGEDVRSISEGGREAVGLRMDIHGRAYFDYARDGRTVVSFDPTWPEERLGEDPHALDPLMEGLAFRSGDDETESISSALALIGRLTRTDIATDWFLAQHSRIRPLSR